MNLIKILDVSSTTTTTTRSTTIAALNQCNPNPCFNNGQCIVSTSGQFCGCFCRTGFSGIYCQNYQSSNELLQFFQKLFGRNKKGD